MRMSRSIRTLPTVAGTIIALSLLVGCDPPSEPRQAATAPAIDEPKPVLWKHLQDSTVVAIKDATVEQSLKTATEEAQRTLPDARMRWVVASPSQRLLWAVKWAAPRSESTASEVSVNREALADHGSVEHVWVQPVTWSAFRIEGTLLSNPTAPLEAGKTRGEAVSFPIDEVSDWIHFAGEEPGAAFEGGFTVRVLEERYGKPGI